jgi:hypothetical protein
MKISLAILVCVTVLFTAPAAAGPSGQESVLFELVLRDGSRLFGSVLSENETEIVFRTDAGAIVTTKTTDVLSLRQVRGRMQDGEFRRDDGQVSRLFFAPTGRSLRKGQVSLGVFEFMMPFVQVGVTDRLSIGGGTPLVFGLDEGHRPFWVTPKVQVLDTGRAQLSAGVFQMFNLDGDDAGIAYGVGTFGSADNALTVGAGLAYSGDEQGGVFMAGGERRVHRNIKLMTENYIWTGGGGIVSGGIRFIGERLAADLALAVPIGVGEFFAFPVVNFVYVF